MATQWKSTVSGYGWISISFHWLMLILIVVTYATIDLKSVFPKGSPSREEIVHWHYMLGLLVFCFVWMRLWARATGSSPVIEPALPVWQTMLAKTVHFALYALMIGLPILGWLTLSAKGKSIPFFGAELPALIEKSQETAKWLKGMHETIATAGYFLVGLHAAAALFHHYVKRDNTLELMLPKHRLVQLSVDSETKSSLGVIPRS
jgi:cytochrome b561